MVLGVQWILRRGAPVGYKLVTGYLRKPVRYHNHHTRPYYHAFHQHSLTNSSKIQSLKRNMCTTGQKVSKPEVIVEPSGHLLVDDELGLSVRGLDHGQAVTVHAVIDVSGKSIESCCHFQADDFGVVDLYNKPSLSGSYTGVSPMGIFWSMVPTPQMPKGFRLSFKNVDKPIETKVDIYNGNLTADDIRAQNPSPVATHMIERWYKAQDVTCVEVTDGRLRGKLFLPPGPGPFPGVIDLFGTVGGILEFRSALLASRGFAALTLPYFGYKDLPTNLYELDLDYFIEAVSWLRAHPDVYGEGVGVVGVSKGADIGFMMATNCPQVRALVNINGCTFNANFPMKYSGGDIPCIEMDLGKMVNEDGAWSTNSTFTYDEKDLLPVWRHNPKILNILSEDDRCGPNECIRLMQDHYPADKKDNYVILSYPDAGHLVEPPYTPCCRMSFHKSFDMYFIWGGRPEPHAHAQEDSWKNILKFLHTNIPKTKPKTSKL